MLTIILITVVLYLAYLVFWGAGKNLFRFRLIYLCSFILVYLIPFLNADSRQSWFSDSDFLFYIYLSFVISVLLIEIFFVPLTHTSYGTVKVLYRINYKKRKLITTSVCIIYLLLIFNLMKNANFNITNLLFSNRVGGYLDDINNFNFALSYIMNALHILTIMLAFTFAKDREFSKATLLYVLVVFYIFLTTHTRYVLMTYVAIPFLYYHFYVRRFKLIGVFFAILAAAIYLSVANFFRTGVAQDYSLSDIVNYETIVSQIEITSVEDFYSVHEKVNSNEAEIEYGKQYFYYLPLTVIPRSIWPEKPFVSYFWRLTEVVTGNFPGPKQFVLTSTFFGEAYHQFGFLGPFLSIIIYLLMLIFLLKKITEIEGAEPLIWLILIHIPMDIRGGLNSIIITFLVYYAILIILKKLSFFELKPSATKKSVRNYI